ncbi:MAG: DUF305 domain-containing protein [Meiothermus sp.]|nr:DUF305 domain-containing protein [Meiothermus sp.]
MKQLLVLFVALAGLALAQTNHQNHHPAGAPASQMPMSQPGMMPMGQGQQGMNMPQMMPMMQGMMGQMGQMGQMGMMGMMGQGLGMLEGAPFEQAFLSMMIPHHRAAVTMARDILTKTQDAQLRGWANAIIRDQEREIAQMRTLLSALGGTNLAAQRVMTQAMSHMGHTAAPASSPERAFIEAMIPHHVQAIEMATLALQKAQNPAVLKLAADIAATQAREVYEMRLKLANAR